MRNKIIEILMSETFNTSDEAGNKHIVISSEDFQNLADRIESFYEEKNKMEKFEIIFEKIPDLENNTEKLKPKIIITSQQFEIIKIFADTRKDQDLNTTYKLNRCEFMVMPHICFFNKK